jgi:hypothetical protein
MACQEVSLKNNIIIGRYILGACMSCQEGLSTNKDPLFDGPNYAFWSIRMWYYLMYLGFDISQSFMTSYIVPTTPPTYVVGKKDIDHNEKSMNVILSGL